MNVPAALERSRSGNGGHLWFFFNEAVPAALARKLGTHILAKTMERRPKVGLDSYDRLFPNPIRLPKPPTGSNCRRTDFAGLRDVLDGNLLFLGIILADGEQLLRQVPRARSIVRWIAAGGG
jgi:hypothetical protein